MNGVRFWRLKRRLTYIALAKKADCSDITIRSLEDDLDHATSALLIRIADALDVSVDELAMEYPEKAIVPGDHPEGRYTITCARLNLVGNYCRAHNISLDEYAALTGKRSRQSAQYAWVKPKPWPKEIGPLAQLEQVSLEEFIARYGEEASK